MARIAQSVGLFAIVERFERSELGGSSKRFSANHGAYRRLSTRNAVCGFVQQQDRTVAIGHGGLHPVSWIDAERFSQFAIDRIELRPGQLRHDRKRIATPQPIAAGVLVCAVQCGRHEADWIETVAGLFGAIVDLAYADNDGGFARVCFAHAHRLSDAVRFRK